MTAAVRQGSLVNLAARLTRPEDRDTYAALISYFESLPPQDELFRLAQLLGLLSLLGQCVPDAITELLIELRGQTAAAAEYHSSLNRRLTSLPQEIAAGVDAEAIAKGMAEAFRQQLAATGLEHSATLLRNASRDITVLTGQMSSSLRPVTQDYKSIAATISAGLEKLTATSERLEEHNAHLRQQQRNSTWLWQGTLALVLFVAGGLCGVFFEKRQTTDVLNHVGIQMQHIETAAESVKTSIAQPKLHLGKDPRQ